MSQSPVEPTPSTAEFSRGNQPLVPTPQWPAEDFELWFPAADVLNSCLDIIDSGFPQAEPVLDTSATFLEPVLPPVEENFDFRDVVPSRSDGRISNTFEVARQQEAPTIPPGIPFLVGGFHTATERKLLFHFITETSRVLTMNIQIPNDNPMITLVLPHALQDTMIQKSVLSLAASHVTNLYPDKCSDVFRREKNQLVEDAESQQLIRWRKISSKGNNTREMYKHPDFEVLLTGMLLLCLYEICDGKGDLSWRIRLNKIRELMRHALRPAPANSRSPGVVQELSEGYIPESETSPSTEEEIEEIEDPQLNPLFMEMFIYHDILATVTDPGSPSVSESSGKWQRLVAGREDVCVFGVHSGLFTLISRVGDLHTRAIEAGRPTGDIICEALSIWKDLDLWQPKSATPSQSLTSTAYKCSLFVWLFLILYPDDIDAERLQGVVRNGISSMMQIDESDGILACMLFPCFFLGVASTTAEDRRNITAQFERLRSWSGLGNVKLTQQVCTRLWEAYDAGLSRPWDWMKHKDLHGISVPVT